jgi:hypothetical protein
MASSKAIDILTAIVRKRGYRQYLWYRLLCRFGYAEADSQSARLRLPDQRLAPMVRPSARSPQSSGVSDPCFKDASAESGCQCTLTRVQRGTPGKVRDHLFEKSPYEGFDPQPYPDDLQGWGSDDPVLVGAIQLLRPARVCEVGSWKGRSAIRMAHAAKALNLDTEIVCVDTWLGSPEHWLKGDPAEYASLRILHGMPRLYYTFLANVVRAGVTDVITPFPMTSENAAEILAKLGVRFDLIYIDAAHEYKSAKRDIAVYYDLLDEDGLLIGDDYIYWPGVTQAADEFVAERSLRMIAVRGKMVIPKGEKYANIAFT